MAIPTKEQIKSMFGNPEMSSFITEKIRDMYHKIVANEQEDKQFSVNLLKLLSGDKAFASRPLIIGKTPNALVVCGADKQMNVYTVKTVIDKCMRPEVRDASGKLVGKTGHGLTIAQLQDAITELRSPAMVLQGRKNHSLIAVTAIKDDKGRNIVVTMELGKQSALGKANSITSIYGRNEFANYISHEIAEGNLLAINTEKADDLLHSTEKSYLKAKPVISFDNSIAYSTESVKYPEQEKSKEFVFTDSIKELTVTEINGHSALALFDVSMSDEGKKSIYERADFPDKPSPEDVFKSDVKFNVSLKVYEKGAVDMEITLEEKDGYSGASIPLTEAEQKKLFELADSSLEKDGGVKSAIRKEANKIIGKTDI